MFYPALVHVVAFDCVHTVFNVSHLTKADRKAYIDQVRRPEWAPLDVDKKWLESEAHEDSAEGIERIAKQFRAVTCSNWPAWALAEISDSAGICWSAIIPMETARVYKPNPIAYLNVAQVCGACPGDVLMVTANETAPDIDAARALGMQAVLIDRENKHGGALPRTIIELAELLGC